MDCRDLSTAQGCPAEAADAYARARELLFNFAFPFLTLLSNFPLGFKSENYPYKDGDGEGRLTLT
jgi:hypothetical protein